MTVLIIEVGGSHIECVYSMVHYLHINHSSVFLACNKKLKTSVKEVEKITAILELPDDPTNIQHLGIAIQLRKFIRKNKIESVVFNTTEITIVRNLILLLPKLNYTGVVHNAKRLEKSFTFTKVISLKMKKFFVLSDYLIQKLHIHKQFKVESFYPVYFPAVPTISPVKPSNEFWITIPGEVFTNRRDYLALINEVEKATNLDDNIKFILLGYNHFEEELNNRLNTSLRLKKHFITFNHYLSYNLFHSFVQQSDFILPLLKTDVDGFYGSSRISGSLNLGIGYQLPFLLPESYKENDDIAPYSIYYSSIEHLLSIVREIQLNQSFKNQIHKEYKEGKFNNITIEADKVYNFILS
jgi:hypothetical protein